MAKKPITRKAPAKTTKKAPARPKTPKKAAVAQKSSKTAAPTRLKAPPAAPAPTPGKLSDRQLRFVAEYMKDSNASQAAKRAGYRGASTVQGSRLLANVHIKALIDAKMQKLLQAADLTVERTLQEIARVAYADPRRIFDNQGALKRIQDLDDDCAASLASVETEETTVKGKVVSVTKKVRLVDKMAALDKAMRYHGAYKKDNEQGRPMLVIKDYTGMKAK